MYLNISIQHTNVQIARQIVKVSELHLFLFCLQNSKHEDH